MHHLLIADAPSWIYEEIDKWMRAFFWAGAETVHGGQCLVAWENVCKPYEYGGLGVKNLRLQGLALRTRWEWLRRTDVLRPWQGLPMMKDSIAAEFFDSHVRIQVGDGKQTLFWKDRWIAGTAVGEIAPLVLKLVSTRIRNKRTVEEGLRENRWMLDVKVALPPLAADQWVRLWIAVSELPRDETARDSFRWTLSESGVYSASSVYKELMRGQERFPLAKGVWKCWAPLKCRIFMWLALQYRIWTSDRRARHGLQEQPETCKLCLQEIETADHLLMQCVYTRQVWWACTNRLRVALPIPTTEDVLQNWWINTRQRFRGKQRKVVDSLITLVCWSIWKQRNARVFGNTSRICNEEMLSMRLVEELKLWAMAGVGPGGLAIE